MTVRARLFVAGHLALAVAVLFLTVPEGGAQEPPSPRAGQRVRVTVQAANRADRRTRWIGTLERREAEAWWITADGTDSTSVLPRTAITRVEISTGPSKRPGRGALLGFLAGFVTGYIYEDTKPNKDIDTRPIMGVLIGLPGALVGALVGNSITTESWEVVALPGVEGTTLAFRVSWTPRSP